MTIYTRSGDQGETELPGGIRTPKDAARLEASGSLEELNAVLGLVRAEPLSDDIDRLLEQLQHELLEILAELAVRDPAARSPRRIGPLHVQAVEEAIDRYEETLEPLREFILPAGARAAAGLHLARTVCRRAERRLVTLARDSQPEISPSLTAYLNRLSDLLFVLARTVNARAGYREVRWRKQS
jgi:cob(I)alamin adenosyltransferase